MTRGGIKRGTNDVVKDLLADNRYHLKRLLRRDRVHQHVAVDADEVLGVQDGVFILAGRIDNLQRVVLVLNLHFLAKRVLDGGVIALDEVVIDVAHGQRRLAYRVEKKESVAAQPERPKHLLRETNRLNDCQQWQAFGAWAVMAFIRRGLPFCYGRANRYR